MLESGWHLPAVTILSVTVLFFALSKRAPFIVGFSVAFGWLILLDAWVNGGASPIPSAMRRPFEILFVYLGDWRYLLLLEAYGFGKLTRRGWLRSLGLAWISPLATFGFIRASGTENLRVIFLFYESAFFFFAAMVLFVVVPRMREASEENRAFVKALTCFILLQYGLWISADLLMLAGFPWAAFIRLTANVLYYALFVPFVWWRAPDSPARGGALAPVVGILLASSALSLAPVALSRPPVAQAPAGLTFKRGTETEATLLLAVIASLPVNEVSAFDPYYRRAKRWRAVPIECVLETGFKRDPSELLNEEFVLRAQDGFAAYFPGRRLLEGGAHVAFEDLDAPAWEPIGPRGDHPGPFYLVWSKPEQQSLETHARPWQLASIEIVSFDAQFPHVRPQGHVTASVERGFLLFRTQCLACHAINRSGGKVGPELNVPRNVLEYRDETTVRAFIRDPQSFRYTVMPAHREITEEQMDDLVGYLDAMRSQKRDGDEARTKTVK